MKITASGPAPGGSTPLRSVPQAAPTHEPTSDLTTAPVATFEEFAQRADYSLLDGLLADPQATADGCDHRPRQVF
ncbi:MAG: hypothetical protein VKK62_02745, partial [Synechococcaceae cyanobacterium]|nr:hypothetical protein [Synechococcaceae cyanobacterium]